MANNILEMALEQLDFPPSTISAWFDDVTVVSFGDNRLVLHSPVPFKKEFIESKFIAPLQEVLHNLTGDPITVVVVTGEYTAPSTSTSPYDDYTFERLSLVRATNSRMRLPCGFAAPGGREQPALHLRQLGSGQNASDVCDRKRASSHPSGIPHYICKG